ncbi:MAG: O-antigen ligase family protein [Aggregatilineales bacterium]
MSRPLAIFIAALIVFAGGLVAAGATSAERYIQLRGYVNATQTSELPFWIPRLGVNAELTQYEPQALAQQLDLMRAAGITWVRQFFRWPEVQSTPYSFDWSRYDVIVEAFASDPQLKLVAVLVDSPAWARTRRPTSGVSAPPDDPSAFAAFAGFFAARYGDIIDYYQIWDEPNLRAAWGDVEPRPAAYAALLADAYAAIHSNDAQAIVIAAALAPTLERGPDNISDLLYLDALYRLGLRDFSDAVAAKPYGFDGSPEDRTVSPEHLNFSRFVALREIMLQHGDAHSALWASHWGWNSLPEIWDGPPSIWGAVTPEQQIAYTLAALSRAEREWPWMGGMILQHWQPAVDLNDPQWGFALRNPDGEPTGLYDALSVRSRITAAPDGLHFPMTPFAQYSGVWTFAPLGADIGWVQDSRAVFEFNGSEIALLLRRDDYSAFLYIEIDGAPANALPRDGAGNTFINLSSSDLQPAIELIPVARGLPLSEHRLSITADRGWDRWALAGYAVSSGDLRAPYDQQLTLAGISIFLSGIAAIVAGLGVDWSPMRRWTRRLWLSLNDSAQILVSMVTSLALLIGMLLTWGEPVPTLFRREPVQLGLALLTGGLLYIAPSFLVVIAACALLFVIFYQRVELGLVLTLFFAPFFLFPVELFTFAFPIAELILLLTIAAAGLRALRQWGLARQAANSVFSFDAWKLLRERFNMLDWVVVTYLILGGAAIFWSEHTRIAITELRVIFLQPALFYALVRMTMRSPLSLLRLLDAFLAAAVLVCLIGLIQFARGEAIITAEEGVRRLASVYGSPNNVGLLLGRAIPFLFAFTLLPVDRMRRGAASSALVLALLTAVLTQSAGALFFGIPAGMAIVLLLIFRRRAWIPLTLLGGAGVLGAALARTSARFANLFDLSTGTGFFRLRLWESALMMIRDRPLTGVGLDQFLYAYRGRYMLPDAWQEPNLSHPHNILLDVWTRLGLLGVIWLIGMQAIFWRAGLTAYHRLRVGSPLSLAMVVGVLGSMTGLLAHGFIDNSIFVQDLSLIFMMLIAIIAYFSEAPAIDLKNKSMV